MVDRDAHRVAFETARLELARLRINADAGHEVALQSALRLCARTLRVERVGFWRFAVDHASLQLELCYTLSNGEWTAGDTLTASRFPRYWEVLNGRRVVAASDARTDPDTAELADRYLDPLGIRSLLDAPVFRAGELIGVICHEQVGEARAWTPEEITFATAAADLLSMLLEQADRLAAERQLRVRTGKLLAADKLDMLIGLAKGLAHDFNNLLLAIELVGGKLAQRGDTEDAASLKACAEMGGHLVGRLKRFGSRSDDASHQPARTVIERMVPILQTLIRDVAVIEVDLGELAPATRVTLRDAQLEQIVLNLCLNARDALGGHGTVKLAAKSLPAARGSAPEVVMTVADDGTGMSDEVASRIWEPYFTTKTHGTGLGLATVRALLDEVGATIELATRPGEGTTFTLHLPQQP